MPPATCVVFNPAAGRGRAHRLLPAARHTYGNDVTLWPTERPGHAVELGERAAVEGFARVVAAGGDGTVHEVANGVLRSGRMDVVFTTLPAGSMNDYAFALRVTRPRGGPFRADVGLVRVGGRERFFVNGLGVGFNGMVALESRKIRRLRGLPLYIAAFLVAGVRHFRTPTYTVRIDDSETRTPTLALSVNLGLREGGFPVTPAARLDDGAFDYLHATHVRRWHLVRYLPRLITGDLPSLPFVTTGTVRRVTVHSTEPLCAHADGEFVCTPADGVTAVEVELLPGRLLVEPPAEQE